MEDQDQVPISGKWLRLFNYLINNSPNTQAPPGWVARRNYFALQYAYIRGDRNLVLHNNTLIDGRYRLYRIHPADHKDTYARPYSPPWQAAERVSSLGGPTIARLLEHRWKGFELRWTKLLRKGGLGLATLWEVEFEDGHKIPVVIKINLSDNVAEFKKEIKWHDRYQHASNIVQRLDLNALARQHRTNGRFDNRIDLMEHFGEHNPLLIIEYAHHGNLSDVLRNIVAHDLRPPSIALWQLWEQLVFAVAEVAYQREFRSRWNTDILTEMRRATEAGPQHLDAFFQKLSGVPISHDIHLDLEESNMLMFAPNEPDTCPKLKFHDFGYYSFNMQREWEDADEVSYWKKRRLAKFHRYLPEQATREWDDLGYPTPDGAWRFTSEELNHGNQIAGRYGSWTNVFIIGRTMETIMTGYFSALPFSARAVNGDPHPTYGWRVFKTGFRSVDSLLRTNVAQCMYERPAHRPSIVNLLRQVVQVRQSGLMENKAHVKKFWSTVLGPPRPPNYPSRQNEGGGGAGGDRPGVNNGLVFVGEVSQTAGRPSRHRNQTAPVPAVKQGIAPRPAAANEGRGSEPQATNSNHRGGIEPSAANQESSPMPEAQTALEQQVPSPEIGRRHSPVHRNIADNLGIDIGFENSVPRRFTPKTHHSRNSKRHASSRHRRVRKQLTRSARGGPSTTSRHNGSNDQLLKRVVNSIKRVDGHEPSARQLGTGPGELGLVLEESKFRGNREPPTPPWRQRNPSSPPPGMDW